MYAGGFAMVKIRRSAQPLVLLLPLLVVFLSDSAWASNASEEDLKTLLVYKIAKFVRWPEEAQPSRHMELCVLGSFDSMVKLNDKMLRDQPIRVRFIKSPAAALENRCRIVFVRSGTQYDLANIATELMTSPILLISDESHSAEMGFMVEIARQGKRLGLRVNPKSARVSGLNLASSLIQLAKVVG
jgi:uncharacterized protein DUF4154